MTAPAKLAIGDLHADLQQEVRTAVRQLHLLLLDDAPGERIRSGKQALA